MANPAARRGAEHCRSGDIAGAEPAKVAVERNLEIVPRSTLADVAIADGDRLEIVHFVGGGDHAAGR